MKPSLDSQRGSSVEYNEVALDPPLLTVLCSAIGISNRYSIRRTEVTVSRAFWASVCGMPMKKKSSR